MKRKNTQILESIILTEAETQFYRNGLEGEFAKRKLRIRSKILTLKEEFSDVEKQEREAPQKIKDNEKRIEQLKQEIKLKEVAPLVERIKKIAGQLAELKGQISELNLSEEDLEILRGLMK